MRKWGRGEREGGRWRWRGRGEGEERESGGRCGLINEEDREDREGRGGEAYVYNERLSCWERTRELTL